MPFLTNAPLPQCLQHSSATRRLLARDHDRGCMRHLLEVKCLTVYPSLRVVLLGTHHAKDMVDPAMGFVAPAMYWYGWTATAALGALAAGVVAATLPETRVPRVWSGWAWMLPVLAMIACIYLTLPWFRL